MRKPERAARRGVWTLARFLHRKQLPVEKEKNALVVGQVRFAVRKRGQLGALRVLGRAFFSFSTALELHGAQKRAKARPAPAVRALTFWLRFGLGPSNLFFLPGHKEQDVTENRGWLASRASRLTGAKPRVKMSFQGEKTKGPEDVGIRRPADLSRERTQEAAGPPRGIEPLVAWV